MKIDHEHVERIFETEPNKVLTAMPASTETREARRLVGEAAKLVHQAVEQIENEDKGQD